MTDPTGTPPAAVPVPGAARPAPAAVSAADVAPLAPAAVVRSDADTAWRLFSRALDPAAARAATTIAVDRHLGEQVLANVSVIA